jgi:hypothetical protein
MVQKSILSPATGTKHVVFRETYIATGFIDFVKNPKSTVAIRNTESGVIHYLGKWHRRVLWSVADLRINPPKKKKIMKNMY